MSLETPCREWRGAASQGYGYRGYGKNRRYMHRWVVETAGEDQFGKPWDPSLQVLHLCDNPPCYRFDHLRLGTAADNAHDRHSKGRTRVARGEEQGHAVLTQADVDEIRRRRTEGEAVLSIAADYPVSKWTIYDVTSGRTWA